MCALQEALSKEWKNKPQTGTKIFTNHIHGKGIVLNINKEPSKISWEKNPIRKISEQKDKNRH